MTKIWQVLAATSLGMGLASARAAEAMAIPVLGLAAEPYALRLKIVWLCAAVAAVVYAGMVYGLVATKRQRPADGTRRAVSRRAELLWAVVPAVILIGLAVPAIDTLAGLAADAEPAAIVAGPSGP